MAYLNGEAVETYIRQAPGTASQITLTAENDEALKLDGSTAKLVWVDVRDENGTVVNTANHTINFTTEGPGFVIGEKAVQVRGGQWAVWVRSTRGEGDITLKATCDGLTAATITIPTQTVEGLPEVPEGGDADETGFVHPEPPAAPVNIFLNKTASASSININAQGEEKAEWANDGDTSTKWCAKNPSPSDPFGTHWWQVDLGRSYTVEEMEIIFDAAGDWKFHVAVSDDPNFEGYTIPDDGILTTSADRATVTVGQQGRYVRIYLNCPKSNLWPCLREVSGTGYTDNVAQGKSAKASTTNAGSDPALAVDGNVDTFWNSGAMSPAWYQVDLGQAYQLTGASLTFAWANPGDTGGIPIRHSFTIQGSLDGTTWYDMATWSDMDQGDNNPNVTATVELSGAARYVKVNNLKAYKGGTSNQWAEIAELEVYGKVLGQPVRLDYGAPTSATSSAEGSNPAYGNDGDPAKYWIPAADDQAPAWQFDSEGLYNIAAVSLTWNNDGTHKYAIDLSTDGQTWTTAVDHLANGVAGTTTNDALSGLTRYVRIRLTAGTTDGLWINSTGFALGTALEAVSVADQQGVTAAVGTAFDQLGLPGTVLVTLDGEVKTPLAVTWNEEGYDPASTQAQTITGTLTAIPGVTVPETLTTSVTVTLEGSAQEANKVLLQKTYDYAKDLDTTGVVQSAVDVFEKALAEAEAVLNNPNATQEQVNTAWDNLLEGIWALGLKQGDKAMLELLIARADDMVANADKYVQANWQQLVDALEAAKAVMADGDALQNDVDQAADALLNAILAQRFKADKSILEGLIGKAEAMDLSGYTAQSVATFRVALANAQAVMADNSLTEDDQAKVDAAVDALNDAMDGLTAGGAPETTDKPETSQKPETTDKPQTTEKPENVPQTGDSAQLMVYVAALAAAALLMGTTVVVRRRRS